jgi:choline dehydrogenase-like flavoprotein
VDFDAIVVGSGFGGTVAATLPAKRKRVLMLERGTWWISPETVGKPPAPPPGKRPMPAWLKDQDQPVQYWPRPDRTEGLLDLFASVHGHANPTACTACRSSTRRRSSPRAPSAAAR